MKSQFEALEGKLIHDFLVNGEKKTNAELDIIMKVPTEMNFKALGNEAKQLFAGKKVLLGSAAGNFMLLMPSGISAKEQAQKLGLKGGGNDQQVQGRDERVIEFL